jgi:rubrerythrin
MFSKADYVKYFLQIRKVELAMNATYAKFAEAVDDPELKKFFAAIERQEKAHARVVDSMLETFGHKEK